MKTTERCHYNDGEPAFYQFTFPTAPYKDFYCCKLCGDVLMKTKELNLALQDAIIETLDPKLQPFL